MGEDVTAPYKDGYIFKGWYKDSNFTEEIPSLPVGSAGDVILYAKWEKEPEGTAEPTATPEGTAEPTIVPDNTAEPTATPAGTAEPTTTPAGTTEPTTTPDGTQTPVPPAPSSGSSGGSGGSSGGSGGSQGSSGTQQPSGGTSAPQASTAPSGAPSSTQQPPESTAAPGGTNTDIVTDVTTTVEDNKTIVVETVKKPDGTESIKETVTEETDNATVVTEKFESSDINANMVITKTYDTDDNVINSSAIIYIGTSGINNDASSERTIPAEFMEGLEEADIRNAEICIEQPAVGAVKNDNRPKILVKVNIPEPGNVSVNKVTLTQESISSAVDDSRKLVVKIVSENPAKSYTVTIPKSELKKMKGDMDVSVQAGGISGMAQDTKTKVEGILSANNVGAEGAYTVSTADNKANNGIGLKVTAPVLSSNVIV